MNYIKRNIENHFFVKVVNNHLTPEEEEYFDSWLAESDSNKERFADFVHLWEKLGEDEITDIPAAEEIWQNISNEISVNQTNKSLINSKPAHKEKFDFRDHRESKYRKIGLWFVRAAAVFLIFFLLHMVLRKEPPRLIESEKVTVNSNRTYIRSTGKGEKAIVPLADGSIVYLNSGSKLTYPRYFDSVTREVLLDGEAYFVIERNEQMPFKVQAGNLITEVLGTEFNVRGRKPGRIDVTVISGKVKTYRSENRQETVEIDNGEMLKFSDQSGFKKIKNIDISKILAWRENKLAFSRTPFEDVLQEIELNFGIRTKLLNEELKSKTLTGVFETDSLNEIILALSISLDVDIYRKGNYLIVE